MDRRLFMKSCGYACLGGIAMSTILQSCTTTKIVTGTINQSSLMVDLSDFELQTKKEKKHHEYILVHNDSLKYPICIYRFSETDYTAIYLQCTHQGAELQVFGNKIQCPAHGSEFNNRGIVEQGPATNQLRTFPLQLEGKQLKITLI
jgi:Rieske Fe-S protein